MAICTRLWPPALRKFPAATSVRPSGVTATVSTRGVVPWLGTVKGMSRLASSAPVPASTAASPPRGWLSTLVKSPATYSLEPETTRSLTDDRTVTWKFGSAAPVTPSSLTTRSTAVPFSWPKLPPTKTERPSADTR